jgi:hypothetical protein
LEILNAAISAVPSVKYALGTAGIAAAAAIMSSFVGGYSRISIISIGLVIIGMFVLFLFSVLITSGSGAAKYAGIALMWAVTVFVIAFMVFTTTAVATGYPCNWAEFLTLRTACQVAEANGYRSPTSSADPVNPQYDRLTEITRGTRQSLCAAEKTGSKVQLFERGWLLYRFDYQTIYVIVRTSDQNVIWTSRADEWHGNQVTCEGVEKDELLYGGFRNVYCASNLNLKTRLGEPLTKEIGVWTQYQEWSKGLLVFGLFPNQILGGTTKGVPYTEHFPGLDGVFLDNDESEQEIGFKTGRRVQYSFHNAEPKDVYCTALWYPISKQAVPDDLMKKTDCPEKVESPTLVKGHDRCLIFGFE